MDEYTYDEHNQTLTITYPNGKKFEWKFIQCGYDLTIHDIDNTTYIIHFDNEHNIRD
jgi:uncharacterized protein YprB with RNaseH-like and TPR domain